MKLFNLEVSQKIENYIEFDWDETNNIVIAYPKRKSADDVDKIILEEGKDYIFITDDNGIFDARIKEIDCKRELISFENYPRTIGSKVDVYAVAIK